jgi:hypothetical protein
MTTYQAITNAQIDQDSPITQDLMTLLRDNPIAGFEGATDAPVNQAAWHGYNNILVGDGLNGQFYNNTSLATVECPNFADGYEYRILGRAVDGVVTPGTFQIQYLIGASWETMYTSTSTAGGPIDFDLWIRSPRRTARRFTLDYSIAFADTLSSWSPSNGDQENGLASIADNNTGVVTRVRFRFASGNVTAGTAFLLRRREF